jgi:hypothetical protein
MPVFFELATEPFKERFDSGNFGRKGLLQRAGAASVRRPMRGVEVKQDTHAILKVVDLMGKEIKLYDSGSVTGKSAYYTNFILQSVGEPREEKFQITETFGDPYIFFYGERPRFLDCSAILINSLDFNWQAEFFENYDKYLRGSRCAEIGARIYMFYDDTVVEGYMLLANAEVNAVNPMVVQLQFKMFLTNYRNISMVGNPNFPMRLASEVDLRTSPADLDVARSFYAENQGIAQGIDRMGRDLPVRSLIHDNFDEWTGEQPADEPYDNPHELDDLIQEAVDEAAANAARMDAVDTIQDAALDRAQRGQGSGGKRPAQKPAVNCGAGATPGVLKDGCTPTAPPICNTGVGPLLNCTPPPPPANTRDLPRELPPGSLANSIPSLGGPRVGGSGFDVPSDIASKLAQSGDQGTGVHTSTVVPSLNSELHPSFGGMK